jgi:hypothetical protein
VEAGSGRCWAVHVVRAATSERIRPFAYPRAHDEGRAQTGSARARGRRVHRRPRRRPRRRPQRPARRRRAPQRACGRRTARARRPTGSHPTFVHLRRGEELSAARTRFDGAVAGTGRGHDAAVALTAPARHPEGDARCSSRRASRTRLPRRPLLWREPSPPNWRSLLPWTSGRSTCSASPHARLVSDCRSQGQRRQRCRGSSEWA